MNADNPAVTALDAIMQGYRGRAAQICGGMSRSARTQFAVHMVDLREILDALNADRCLHCREAVGFHKQDDETYWWHKHSAKSACDEGSTMAEPAPRRD